MITEMKAENVLYNLLEHKVFIVFRFFIKMDNELFIFENIFKKVVVVVVVVVYLIVLGFNFILLHLFWFGLT